jgi:hypothetical protein
MARHSIGIDLGAAHLPSRNPIEVIPVLYEQWNEMPAVTTVPGAKLAFTFPYSLQSSRS